MDERQLRASIAGASDGRSSRGLRIGLVHDGGPAVGRHARLRELFPGCDVDRLRAHATCRRCRGSGRLDSEPGQPDGARGALPEHTMVVLEGGEPEFVALTRMTSGQCLYYANTCSLPVSG